MIIVPVTPPPPSPRAMELGKKVADLIRIYKQEYPDMNFTEVAQAMRVAEKEVRPDFGGISVSTQAILVGLILVVMLMIGFVFFFSRAGGEMPPLLLMAIIGVMVFVGFAVAIAKRR